MIGLMKKCKPILNEILKFWTNFKEINLEIFWIIKLNNMLDSWKIALRVVSKNILVYFISEISKSVYTSIPGE